MTYPKELYKEYTFLRKKYRLNPIDQHLWRFMRLRPSNFPTIRIAQFTEFMFKSSFLFSKMLEIEKFQDLLDSYEVATSKYWSDHYVFDKQSPSREKRMGKNAIHLIIINSVVPLLFLHGRIHGKQSFIDRSLKFLDAIPGETNAIIRKWSDLGLSTHTSFNTQALLQLKKFYCNKRRCLECGIGNEIFKKVV